MLADQLQATGATLEPPPGASATRGYSNWKIGSHRVPPQHLHVRRPRAETTDADGPDDRPPQLDSQLDLGPGIVPVTTPVCRQAGAPGQTGEVVLGPSTIEVTRRTISA
jgi:hypothetical protein